MNTDIPRQGIRLRAYLGSTGQSQVAVARATGIPRAILSQAINDRAALTDAQARALRAYVRRARKEMTG